MSLKSGKSQLGSAIRAAAEERTKQESSNAGLPESQHAVITESQHAVQEEPGGEWVKITVRVHKRDRLHWLISAKKNGTSLTEAITEALNERFGQASDED